MLIVSVSQWQRNHGEMIGIEQLKQWSKRIVRVCIKFIYQTEIYTNISLFNSVALLNSYQQRLDIRKTLKSTAWAMRGSAQSCIQK